MELVKDAYVDQSGAYYRSGGLIVGTQRIPNDHEMEYWQQANVETALAKINRPAKTVDTAMYVGRIPTHFGHFLLEGLPRLCDAVSLNVPTIGYITDGFLPEGIVATPREEIEWAIRSITTSPFLALDKEDVFHVKTLLVPTLPIKLSHSCAEPWRMTPMIQKLIKKARSENKDIKKPIWGLYLRRSGENDIREECDGYVLSDPSDKFSRQIAKVSYAPKLMGVTGSNTHLSMFAPASCETTWFSRGDSQQGDRNQLICDLVRTYNA